MLPLYYTRYFPQNILCRWLSCGNSPKPLSNRELSFTLADDVYLRYLSISNQKEFQTLLQKKCPHKLDIGAVYNTKYLYFLFTNIHKQGLSRGNTSSALILLDTPSHSTCV